jgi:hypothetical protein
MADVEEIIQSAIEYVKKERQQVSMPGHLFAKRSVDTLMAANPDIILEERYDQGYHVDIRLKNY